MATPPKARERLRFLGTAVGTRLVAPLRRFGKWLSEGEPVRLPAWLAAPSRRDGAGIGPALARSFAPAGRFIRKAGAAVGHALAPVGLVLTRPLAPVGRPLARTLAPVGRLLARTLAPLGRLFAPVGRALGRRRPFRSVWVRFVFSVQMAGHGILAKPLRSALTILGVTIGVASVVSLMGVGEGARQAVLQQFRSLGSNVIVIRAEDPSVVFRPEDADEVVERVHTLTMATPVVDTKATMRWRRTRGEIKLLGVNESFPEIRDQPLISGHFFTKWHVLQRSPVAVLGYNVAVSLMRGRSPVGQTFSMAGQTFRIVGVLAPKGEGAGEGIDDKIVIPYTTALQIAGKRTVTEIWAKADSGRDANLATVQLGRIYKRKLGLDQKAPTPLQPGEGKPEEGGKPGIEPAPPSGEPGQPPQVLASGKPLLTITNLNRLVKEADKANRVMTLLLGGIAAVSLLVGGLGIMNIMLVAVTERTAEIGVRRALGAKQGDLLTQFLLEAFFLSAVGAIAGVAAGLWGADLFSRYGLETTISATAIEVAVSVALGTGLLFGVYPAWAASSVPPAEALRR